MYDLITIGDITVDLYFKGEALDVVEDKFSLQVGSKYTADFFHQGLGGGAGNVAIDASTFELDTAVCALVGENAFKQIIIQNLVKKNVSTELLQFSSNFVNISSILLTKDGERTIIHFPTKDAQFSLSDEIKNRLKTGKCYYFGHLPYISFDEKMQLIDDIRQQDKPIFLNIGADDASLGLKKVSPIFEKIDGIIMNSDELSLLLDTNKSDLELSDDISKKLQSKDKIIIITDGENGSYCYCNNNVYYQKAVIVNSIVDTTGVGDAYTAAFIASFLHDTNIQECMKIASEFASKKLLRLGAN